MTTLPAVLSATGRTPRVFQYREFIDVDRHSAMATRNVGKIPTRELHLTIAEIDAFLEPCGQETAARHAEILIGSYPKREVNDAGVYARAIVSVLAELPAEISKATVDRVTRTCSFFPTRADVCKVADVLVDQWQRMRGVCQALIKDNDGVERQLHERQEYEAPREPFNWKGLREIIEEGDRERRAATGPRHSGHVPVKMTDRKRKRDALLREAIEAKRAEHGAVQHGGTNAEAEDPAG